MSSGESWTVSPLESSTTVQEGRVTTDVVDDRAKPLTAAASCLYSALANFKVRRCIREIVIQAGPTPAGSK